MSVYIVVLSHINNARCHDKPPYQFNMFCKVWVKFSGGCNQVVQPQVVQFGPNIQVAFIVLNGDVFQTVVGLIAGVKTQQAVEGAPKYFLLVSHVGVADFFGNR